MPFKTVYSSDFYKIEVDLEGNLLLSEWLRHVTEDELITGGTKLYETLRDTQVERAIANGQILETLTQKAKDWMSYEFYELLSQTNLKKLARVLPKSVFHQLALESVITRAEALGKTRFEVKSFSDPDQALAWIIE
ncbi:hypothetical protein H8S95_00365 [Pontibacter sp. KCTC 32443]|uniref:hypothetical protein n=1 Tax=Pontibacter TaxID=323449 RepID=UPI00164E0AC3|nr:MULTISPECIES: hypothetical protein [Pontibacter]MBC5772504.1 hypothetical protein [Pontibacter sp. KCTC 32443]